VVALKGVYISEKDKPKPSIAHCVNLNVLSNKWNAKTSKMKRKNIGFMTKKGIII